MSINQAIVGAIVVAALAATQAASAQSRPAAPAASSPAKPAAALAIAPEADRALKEVGAYIGSASQFVFHADLTFDHVLPSGQKLQFSAAEEIVLQRPGRLYVEWNSDLGARQFWYDGKSVTLYDPATPFYASAAAPPDIDAMLNQLVPKLDFAPPLADFLYTDPYKQVRGNIQYGFDLGHNDINGRNCRTFAFVEKNIDWQIWIENGPELTPCKLVITYKTQPSQPQFQAVFTNWDFTPRIAPSVFTPELPPGTEKIPFATVAAAAISVAGNPYYYANGVYYGSQGGQYVVVAPPQGAVVASPPPSCSQVYVGGVTDLDCGGAFYAPVAGGYQVIPPPVGATTWTLPDGAADENVGGVTYFAYGGAYYRPFYSGSSVFYEVVPNPA